jgi:hypothetical protein
MTIMDHGNCPIKNEGPWLFSPPRYDSETWLTGRCEKID